jgi:L-threonylcarbamoyladenylate synthase
MYATSIDRDIDKAIRHLAEGNLVAIPTETVYGLAADALNEDAVLKIYTTKGRPSFNPLIVHLANVADIPQYCLGNIDFAMQIAEQFMPGPLSILVPRNTALLPDVVCAGLPKIGIRIPATSITRQLIEAYGKPLCAPSANKSGYVSPTSAQHVLSSLQGDIPYILDDGECSVGLESTIIECIDNEVWLHRKGGVAVEAIEQFIGKKVMEAIPHHAQPSTSGQLKSHYATNTPLILGNVTEQIKLNASKQIAIISFYKEYDGASTFALSPTKNINEAAKNLFSTLRKLDNGQFDIIIAEHFPNEDLGAAINDRLYRAQSVMK